VLETLFQNDRTHTAFTLAGYLVFDALIGNTDRHHQNWGVVLAPKTPAKAERPPLILRLAPTFDHASSLGRELSDSARERYGTETALQRYIRNGKGGIFGEANTRHGLSPIAVAELLAVRYPKFFKPWQTRVSRLLAQDLNAIISRIPDERISTAGRKFALALLSLNQKLIREIP
jgi:hypothetical protein